MKLQSATAISLLVHAAILAALVAGAGLFVGSRGTGPGETVNIWIEAPEGAPGPSSPSRKGSAQRVPSGRAHGSGAIEAERSPAAAASDGAGGGSAADGVGVPGGEGAGGNPLLSRIWRRINSSKYYPASARRRGLTGMPRVTFAIGEDGSVKWVRLARSSGTAILDEAALAAVRRAAPLPYYPKPITLAVKYSLGK